MSPKSKRELALNEAVEGHGVRLLATIKRRIRDQAEAEDIVQEVYAEYLSTYDVGEVIESLGAWLTRVAQNKILDRFRKNKSANSYLESLPEEELGDDPYEEWTRGELRDEILDALEMLPPEQREVFVQHELEGLSFQQISEATGVSVNTLLSRKRYAVLFLREHLKEIYDELE